MSTEPGAPSLKQLRILIADHDPVSATQTEAALRRRLGTGAQFTRSATLAQTIRAMLDTPQDAVLLELGLPDAGGIASVVGVRSAAPLVPIVVHTAVLDDMLALRALRAGAQECTEKGMAPESLVRMLGFAIERQRRLAMLEAARVEAAHRATHDPLTGLANRELFQDQLERALAFGSRYNRKTGLIFVDLDGFKAINDTRGHALVTCCSRWSRAGCSNVCVAPTRWPVWAVTSSSFCCPT